jgi:monoamine oxidase
LPHAERSDVVLKHLSAVHPQLNDRKIVNRTRVGVGIIIVGAAELRVVHARPALRSASPHHRAGGRIFFAGEHASLTHTWIQGAFESALRAVREMLQEGT